VYSVRLLAGLLVTLLLCTGCDQGPTLYPATGTVTYEGKPVTNAAIVFGSQEAQVATGGTDASGKFTLVTQGKPGIPKGTYQVTVYKAAGTTEMSGTPSAEDMKNAATSGGPTKPKLEIPPKYAAFKTTDLSATVTEDAAKNVFNFELK